MVRVRVRVKDKLRSGLRLETVLLKELALFVCFAGVGTPNG